MINVKNFGAVGDGSTDDTTAIEAAINSLTDGGTVYFPTGQYNHTGISVSNRRFITLIGESETPPFRVAPEIGTRLVNTSNTHHLNFHQCHGIRVKGLHFSNQAIPTAGTAIRFFSPYNGAGYCSVVDCRFEQVFNGIEIDGVANSTISGNEFDRPVGDFGIKVHGTQKRVDQTRIIDNVLNTQVEGGSTKTNGIVIGNDTHTTFLERNSIIKARIGYLIEGAVAPEFTRFNASEAERCHFTGIVIGHANMIWMNDIYSSVNYQNGIYFTSSFDSMAEITNCDLRGNSQFGMLLDGSGGVHVTNPRICGNSNEGVGLYHGLLLASNVGNVSVIGGKIGGDVMGHGTGGQASGICCSGGSGDKIVVQGVDLTGNQTAIIDASSGTKKSITGNII